MEETNMNETLLLSQDFDENGIFLGKKRLVSSVKCYRLNKVIIPEPSMYILENLTLFECSNVIIPDRSYTLKLFGCSNVSVPQYITSINCQNSENIHFEKYMPYLVILILYNVHPKIDSLPLSGELQLAIIEGRNVLNEYKEYYNQNITTHASKRTRRYGKSKSKSKRKNKKKKKISK